MIYIDGFIMGSAASYEDRKAFWERASREKEEKRLAEEFARQEEQEQIQVSDDMTDEEIIDNIETIIEESIEDCYSEGM